MPSASVMNLMPGSLRNTLRVALLALVALPFSSYAAQVRPVAWKTSWNEALFAQAAREHRLVLLDLHAVWCHWCHVMDEETYADPKVRTLIGQRYLAVSIDADSDPSLSSRYGDWGWPATIVLAADGTEIVKRRGFIPPAQMASLLQAIIDDPTPGPSVRIAVPVSNARATGLTDQERIALLKPYEALYDAEHGGWGTIHKFLDAPTLEYTFTLLSNEKASALAARRARQTLDANLNLIDPVWGGVYQYSDEANWKSPHFEKLLAFQADDLRLYSQAYAQWQDPKYLKAALALRAYLVSFLASPEGAFYVSQDADLSAEVSGREYYRHDEAARRRLGIPRIDTHRYARENGWAIRALCEFHDVTADAQALAQAQHAADWVLGNRALAGGGFRHDASDRGGPYLEDTVSMGEAFLALYRSSGERRWLNHSRAAMTFIATNFTDPAGGYISASAPKGAHGVFRQTIRAIDQNAAVVRLANRLRWYTGDTHYKTLAQHGMKYLIAAAAVAPDELHAEVLAADAELAGAPIHITVVGAKSDPAAQALHASALKYPAEYLQVDWWDRAEGPLPNREIRYPRLARAAAFACTPSSCSTPVFEAPGIAAAVRRAL
jgi:uncharacterized protein